jgi:transcriptional regulator NrdR family protein
VKTVRPPVGLECPRCGCRHFRVIYTRPRNGSILRRKECRHCGRRVVTRERIGD